MSRKKHQPERVPFAEVVLKVEQSVPVSEITTIEHLGAKRSFVDEHGVEWRRRGDGLGERQLLRLLLDASVVVVHEYEQTIQVSPEDRQRFWDTAVERMEESEYSEFRGAEFRNAHNERLLVVTEYC